MGEPITSGKEHHSAFALPWPFLVLCGAVPALTLAFFSRLGLGAGFMAAFDISASIYVAMLFATLGRHSPDRLQAEAKRFDQSRSLRLATALILIGVVASALASELITSGRRPLVLALSLLTLACAWTFANVSFAVHYAHMFHPEGAEQPGLDFPGDEPPDFWDFAYFAFVLGMTFQVSDVAIRDRRIRRHALVHSLCAFLFSLVALALSVNLVASAV